MELNIDLFVEGDGYLMVLCVDAIIVLFPKSEINSCRNTPFPSELSFANCHVFQSLHHKIPYKWL